MYAYESLCAIIILLDWMTNGSVEQFPPAYVRDGFSMHEAGTGYTDNDGSSVDQKVLTKSDTSTHCPWKV